MLNKVSRRLFLSAGLSSVAAGLSLADLALAGAPERSLRPLLRGSDFHKRAVQGPEAIVAEAKLGGRVAYAVADAKSGKILEGSNEAVGVAPASVTKAITALYALDILGAGHRFSTQIIATGGVSNGVVGGDLVLVGGGDPTLDTNALADLARRLKAAGIREVRGGFKVYDGALPFVNTIDKDQPDHVGYSPAVSGVALNFNRVHFEWRRTAGKYSVSMDARTDKYRPDVSMATMRIAQRSLPVYGYKSSKGIDSWTVARSALGGGGSRWLPVRNPGLYAGDVFRTLAASQGIRLSGAKVVRQAPKGTVLAAHRSAPLNDIVRDMLKFSNNLVAEMVGLSASQKATGKVSGLKGSAKQMNAWARKTLGVQGLDLVDHSGLGAANRMTAMAMAQALVKVYGAGQLQPLLKPIALRDAQGRVQKNHPIKVRAKTGTLNFVSALAGYMQAPDGRELVFAVFAEDQKTRARITKANREAPQGGRSWNRRAKKMQQKMIERWGTLYGS